jgi:hypothetical protein
MPIEPTDRLLLHPPDPDCPDCLRSMRFVASIPDGTSVFLWRVMFACDCGRTDQVIAQTLLREPYFARFMPPLFF